MCLIMSLLLQFKNIPSSGLSEWDVNSKLNMHGKNSLSCIVFTMQIFVFLPNREFLVASCHLTPTTSQVLNQVTLFR